MALVFNKWMKLRILLYKGMGTFSLPALPIARGSADTLKSIIFLHSDLGTSLVMSCHDERHLKDMVRPNCCNGWCYLGSRFCKFYINWSPGLFFNLAWIRFYYYYIIGPVFCRSSNMNVVCTQLFPFLLCLSYPSRFPRSNCLPSESFNILFLSLVNG